MAKGDSGRVVVEVDPSLKRRLHGTLALANTTLKDWFVRCAESYLEEQEQPMLPIKFSKKKRPRGRI
jgi:hypothetical protein